eukprot:6191286-Pleurochrysis_carterae.AAC.1
MDLNCCRNGLFEGEAELRRPGSAGSRARETARMPVCVAVPVRAFEVRSMCVAVHVRAGLLVTVCVDSRVRMRARVRACIRRCERVRMRAQGACGRE